MDFMLGAKFRENSNLDNSPFSKGTGPAASFLQCRGCYERVEIPRQVLRARMPQEAVLLYKQEFAKKHIDQGCEEASQVVAAVKYKLRNTPLEIAQRVLGGA